MTNNKRYACHRVYDSCNHYLSQSVVAIAGDGKVIGCHPLLQETSFTEWIGGVVILSPLSELPPYTDFSSLKEHLTSDGQGPLYAWHLSGFDFQAEELTSESIIRRLPFSV